MSEQRSMVLFAESIKSKYTKCNYVSHLNTFKKFVGIDDEDEFLNMSGEKLQAMLENYVIHLKHTANPNSIPSKFKGLKHFCIVNRIKVNWDIIHKFFPQKQKPSNLRAYSTNEINAMLSTTTSLRDKALIHFLASTGVRIGVFDHDLTIQHMKHMPSKHMAVLFYAGSIEEYWSFLTPQATKSLTQYHVMRKNDGEIFDSDTPIFATSKFASKQLSLNGARSVIYRIVSKTTVRLKQGDRFDVQIDHGFRKRYNTILKLDNHINYNVAEKLMGHKNGLDGVYFTPTLDELFTEFKKISRKIET